MRMLILAGLAATASTPLAAAMMDHRTPPPSVTADLPCGDWPQVYPLQRGYHGR